MKPTTDIPDWYEEIERIYVRKHLPRNAGVLEIGAGMGAVTREILRKTPFVTACEPQAEPYKYLRKNAERALCLPVAVSATGDPVTLSLYDEPWAANQWHFSALGSPTDYTVVPTVGINSLLRLYSFEVLVMDIEGAEVTILQEADLSSVGVLIAEFHPDFCNKNDLDAAHQRLHWWGFDLITSSKDRDTVHVLYEKQW